MRIIVDAFGGDNAPLEMIKGAQMARQILDGNGCENVRIERISGKLTDHYDPRTKTVNLSDAVYD